MTETIKIQYTDPLNGFERLDTIRLDLVKFRKDESGIPSENFFLTASVQTYETLREVPDLVEAALVANPLNPYACSAKPVIYGIVKYKPTTTSLVLSQNPTTLGFVANVPVAILRTHEEISTPVCYITPTTVGTSSLDFAASLSSSNIKEGYVAVQVQIPTPYAGSFTKENKSWGAKSVLERPAPPVLDANVEGSTIKVTLTEPTIAGITIKKYNIYVISQANETFDPVQPILAGNRKPDVILSPGDTLNKPITTWGGGIDAGGGNVSTGTYYVIAVSKNIDTDMACNVSYLSNIDTVTV